MESAIDHAVLAHFRSTKIHLLNLVSQWKPRQTLRRLGGVIFIDRSMCFFEIFDEFDLYFLDF